MPAIFNLPLPLGAVRVYVRPDADDTDGSWTNEAGSNVDLYASIDEVSASDTDYIKSAQHPSNDLCKIRLSNFSSSVAEPMSVRYRYKKDTTSALAVELRVRLLQGATQIASWTHSDISATYANATQTLSSGEVASITDFTDLFLEFRANQS